MLNCCHSNLIHKKISGANKHLTEVDHDLFHAFGLHTVTRYPINGTL